MTVIVWPAGVNQKVLSETSITTGEGGFKEDKSDNGWGQRRPTSFVNPDKYNVQMDFDWEIEDSEGLTEYNRFMQWYKFMCKFGANPFVFPSINKQMNINGSAKMCHYKITSPLQQQESGSCMRITMTWEEVFSGYIEATPFHQPALQSITRQENGICFFNYYGNLTTVPTVSDINLKRKENGSSYNPAAITVTDVNFIRDNTIRVVYEPIVETGQWLVYADDNENISFVEVVQ